MNIEEIKKAIKNNSNYWEKRALENKLSAIENEEDYLRRISGIYDHANKQIDEKLAKVYARYAKENNLTLEEAYKQLPKKMETEYKKDVMDYVNKAKDPSYKQYLLNQSIMHKHSVLDQLRTEMRDVIYDIDVEETGGKFLEKIFTDSNYRAQYSNNEEAFAKVDKQKIQNLLKENWSGGGNFSELIWKDREKLVKALDDIVMKGLATGDNYDKMSDKLAKRMDTSKSNAKRLIMTESARMENEGLLSYYQRIGAKQLIFVATLDMKTSEICRAMDGTIIDIENAKIGLNVPPLHPYCRSVISPHYEGNEPGDRVYRDVETGKTKSGRYRTYKEYLEEELRDKKQAEALASTRNDLQTLVMALGTTYVQPTFPQAEPTEYQYYTHVTKSAENVDKIIEEGFETNPNGINMFGEGVYFCMDDLTELFYKKMYGESNVGVISAKINTKDFPVIEIRSAKWELDSSEMMDTVISQLSDKIQNYYRDKLDLYSKPGTFIDGVETTINPQKYAFQDTLQNNLKGIIIKQYSDEPIAYPISRQVGGNQVIVFDKSRIKTIKKKK